MPEVKITPVILCGGGGTRLWPLSTPLRPKQFLNLSGDRSMLAETAARVSGPDRFKAPLAIGSARHDQLLREALPEGRILLEPIGRNSAPPIAAACLMNEPDDLLLVLPADHHIQDVPAFLSAIETGVTAAQDGQIVTFGIPPDYPATGYGYIEAEGAGDTRAAIRFVEKPDHAKAVEYLETGRFFWNAGIFLFRSSVMLDALRAHASDILKGVDAALSQGELDRTRFRDVRSDSIDYAVLEKAPNITVVPVSMGWSDLGDFRALHEAGSDDESIYVEGHAEITESANVYVRAEGVKVAVHGLDDVAVVATPENILVTRLSDAAGIKPVTGALSSVGRIAATLEQRVWLQTWLWYKVMPVWAGFSLCKDSGGCIENIDLDGRPRPGESRRGRIAPRQLFSFARAKRLGWNPDGAADRVIEGALAFINSAARHEAGGWAHKFNADGTFQDGRRDLYDHAFVALSACELVALGDARGEALAHEAFSTIDKLFYDERRGGWHDPETGPGVKRANPHMHLLEASLAHYEAVHDGASLKRINTLCTMFEQHMFDPASGAMIENFNSDWSRQDADLIEPGHCFEWAYLLGEAQRLTGRDSASWRRRLIDYAENHGIQSGFALDAVGAVSPSFRLWPQLERIRALCHTPRPGADIPAILEGIIDRYLQPGPSYGWIDRLGPDLLPAATNVPASMVYHLMTALAPIAPPPAGDK